MTRRSANRPCRQNNTALSTGLCTDSTWQDQACFPRCLKPSRRPGPSSLYRCSNDLWCCSNGVANTTSCCQDGGINLFPITAHATVENGSAFLHGYSIAPLASIMTGSIAASPSSSLTHSVTTDVAGSVIATASSATASSSADSGAVLATGLYSGLGVGIPLLAVVSVLSFLLMREKRLHRATIESLSSVDSYGYPLVTPATSRLPSAAKPPVHLDPLPSATTYPVELNASTTSMSHTEADSREKRVSRKELPGS